MTTRAARSWSIVAMSSSLAMRLIGIALVGAALCTGIAAYLFWLTSEPQTVAAKPSAGRSADLTLQTVAALGPRYPAHPDWVSYLARRQNGRWVHSTNLTVPAHSLIRVTIRQYDTSTGLRNPYFSQVQGTSGGTMQLDGRTVKAVPPSAPAHTFAIPQLGVFVPLPGVADDAPNQCSAAPCTQDEAHHTITFTFRTKGKGHFRWQCFVPCGAGYVTGFGGPMQAFNYMSGYVTVA